MRRALLTGLVIGVLGGSTVVCAVASAQTGSPARAGGSKVSWVKTVTYGDLRFSVPRDWPVYDLRGDRDRCVRFDVHAVYLGRPGADQFCPAHVRGLRAAVLVEPLEGAEVREPGVRRMTRSGGGTVPESVSRRTRVAVPGANVMMTVTYGDDLGAARRVVRSGRVASSPSSRAGSPHGTGGPSAGPARDGGSTRATGGAGLPPLPEPTVSVSRGPAESPSAGGPSAESPSAESPQVSSPGSAPSSAPSPSAPSTAVSPTPTRSADEHTRHAAPRDEHTHLKRASKAKGDGFDACTAPSKRAMRAWRNSFTAANIYIGGAARACADGNLSKSWVRAVKKMGWKLIPTYVGLQAPCNPFSAKIDPGRARAQGRDSANDAISEARSFGLSTGAPLYFDMEGYNSGDAGCRTAVRKFLDGWTDRLHERDYISGVYGSVSSTVVDLAHAKHITKPDGIWFAHWDGKANTTSPYMSSSWWPGRQRIKQYRGAHTETHGGVRLSIDSNRVDGFVY